MPDTFSPSGPILLPLKDICRSFCCLATSANTWQVHFAWHSTTNRSTTTQLHLPWPLRCLSKSIQSQWTSGRAWAVAVLLRPVTSKAKSIAGAFGMGKDYRGHVNYLPHFVSLSLSLSLCRALMPASVMELPSKCSSSILWFALSKIAWRQHIVSYSFGEIRTQREIGRLDPTWKAKTNSKSTTCDRIYMLYNPTPSMQETSGTKSGDKGETNARRSRCNMPTI